MTSIAVKILQDRGYKVVSCDHVLSDDKPVSIQLPIGKKRMILLCADCTAPIEAALLKTIFTDAVKEAVAGKMLLK